MISPNQLKINQLYNRLENITSEILSTFQTRQKKLNSNSKNILEEKVNTKKSLFYTSTVRKIRRFYIFFVLYCTFYVPIKIPIVFGFALFFRRHFCLRFIRPRFHEFLQTRREVASHPLRVLPTTGPSSRSSFFCNRTCARSSREHS